MDLEKDIKLLSNTEPIYTLGIISKLSDISVYSIRQYIDKQLIIPFRTNSGRHLFSNIDLLRLKCVHKNLTENVNGSFVDNKKEFNKEIIKPSFLK